MTTTLDYDSLGRISQRYVAQGYSDYTYDGNTDWLARETWHAATSGNVFDLVRYWYANGRPSRVEAATVSNDLQTLNYYTTYYLEYNWHGDLTNYVTTDGIGGNNAIQWSDPWGQPMQTGPAWNYYSWDGGWGYLSFPSLGLYYVHGRWYNPDIGRFISPDAKGDYRYGSGDDAVNLAWVINEISLSPTQTGESDLKALKYKWTIQFEARTFGLPWQVLAGVLESEMQLDTDLRDYVRDIVVNMDPWVCDDFPNAPLIGGWCQNPAGGIANIHILTAKSTAKYMSERYASSSSMQLVGISENTPAAMIYYPYLLSEPGSIFVMAAHVRQLADYRFGSNGQPSLTSHANLSQWTITDAVAVWHGYRYGVPLVSPNPSGFASLDVFQNRSYTLDELITSVVKGRGNPQQSALDSVKYFQAYWAMSQ